MDNHTQTPSTDLIPVFAGSINELPAQLVDARTLHSFLEVQSEFRNWIKNRIDEYSFIENQDYLSFAQNLPKPKGGRPSIDYHLTLDMAKELAMVERNDKGREARRYFIACERRLHEALPALPPPREPRALPPPKAKRPREWVAWKVVEFLKTQAEGADLAALRARCFGGEKPPSPLGEALEALVAAGAVAKAAQGGKAVFRLADAGAVAFGAEGEPRESELQKAMRFLFALLAQGPVEATAAAEACLAEGVSGTTLKRAKAALGVASKKAGSGGWLWSLEWTPPAPPHSTSSGQALANGGAGGPARAEGGAAYGLRRLAPPAAVSAAQRGVLSNRVADKARASGKLPIHYWKAFNSYFKLASYEDLPEARFAEAVEFLGRLEGGSEPLLFFTRAEIDARVAAEAGKAAAECLAEAAKRPADPAAALEGMALLMTFGARGHHHIMPLTKDYVVVRKSDPDDLADLAEEFGMALVPEAHAKMVAAILESLRSGNPDLPF